MWMVDKALGANVSCNLWPMFSQSRSARQVCNMLFKKHFILYKRLGKTKIGSTHGYAYVTIMSGENFSLRISIIKWDMV